MLELLNLCTNCKETLTAADRSICCLCERKMMSELEEANKLECPYCKEEFDPEKSRKINRIVNGKALVFCKQECFEKYRKEQPAAKIQPELGEFDAKLIFVRNLGKLHYSKREFSLNEFLELPSPVKDLTKEQVMLHISGLERSIQLLKAYAQGQDKGYVEEVEPELREKRQREEKVRDAKRQEPKTVEGMLAKVGMSKEQFMAELFKRMKAKAEEMKIKKEGS